MRKALVLLLGMCFVVLLIGSVAARDVVNPGLRPMKAWSDSENPRFNDPGLRYLYEEAALDTYTLAWYTFESLNWQGWTVSDETGQRGIFYHVDDFVGVSPGLNGHLVPIEGTKSMWVGCRPNGTDFYVCSWVNPPGYGNGWNQNLGTDDFAFTGAITISFHMKYDSEPDYDYTRVQYDAGGGNWQNIATFTSFGDTVGEYTVPLTLSRTKVRFHFTSDGAWSDADGLWNTDGGSQVDSIRLRDVAPLDNFENFEAAAVGATSAGIWIGSMGPAYGSYGGMLKNLADKDACGDNFSTQVVFFIGSSEISPDYPGLYNTPFCMNGVLGPCQNELFVSPLINMTKYSSATPPNNVQNATIPPADVLQLGGAALLFTVYRDLPLENLVLYTWGVRQIAAGCPGQWLDRNFVYYGADQDFIFQYQDVSDLIGGTNDLQVGIGVADMCSVWYLLEGNCAAHTPSPWFDNVRILRWKTSGPQWSYRDLDLFQDNFPREEYDLNSTANADIANDLNRNDNPIIRAGDSAVVTAQSLALGGPIGTDPAGGPAVYLHVRAIDIGPLPHRPNLVGPSLAGTIDTGRVGNQAPFNFRYVSDDLTEWTIIQCAAARTGGGFVVNKYMVDLNDNLFQRGYEIDYYFTAKDAVSPYVETALPRRARSGGPYFEFTILPTQVSDVLFVDDWSGRGSLKGWVQDYWEDVFENVLIAPDSIVDRYDVNGPSSGVSNGPGSRAKNKQLTDQYYKIVWDSGDLESVTISDGTVDSDQSHDCQMLIDWMSLSTHEVGLWVCGDDIAYDLDRLTSTEALSLLSTWCGVDFVATSYYRKTGGLTGGGRVNPLITGDADSGVFTPGGVPETFYLYGGCGIINEFDCLEKTTDSKYALRYPIYGTEQYYCGISNVKTNSASQTVRTMWFGFSFMYVRDDVIAPPADRFKLASEVFAWMNNDIQPSITPAETPKSYKLAQNFPNPFNPSTSIKFDMKAKGLVTLKVYNVARQLVRTLVNGTKDAGSYTITWDGKNDRGGAVASGIYFYKMETKDFSQTKKMVMLR